MDGRCHVPWMGKPCRKRSAMCQAWERSRHSVVTTASRRRRAGSLSPATTTEEATAPAPTVFTNVRLEIMLSILYVLFLFAPTDSDLRHRALVVGDDASANIAL